MYDISDGFKIQMKKQAQYKRLRGKVGGIDFDQSNVLQGTFSITNQCSDSSNIQIGQVYVGELSATFRNLAIARNTWKGKEIVAYQGLKVGGEFEDILLGHYFVDDAQWSRAGVAITAYDAMSKFDKSLKLTSSEGKPYDFISLCCFECDVELGMTEAELLNFNNGKEVFSVYPENEMETYRDLLSWAAQAIGANAMIDRNGKLILKQYGGNAVDSFDSFHRLEGGTASDFATFYTGVSCVNMGKQTTSYYGAEVDNGLTMNLGSNPLLQIGKDSKIEEVRRNVLSAIQNINYTPITMKLNTPFVYDLMDVLEFTGGIVGSGGKIQTSITKYTWKFNGEYTIECSGSNPALATGKSKTDKNIAGLLDQVDSSKIITYNFVNAKDVDITSSKEKVISIAFTSKVNATAMFFAEILLEVTTDSTAIVQVDYRLNEEFIEAFVPKQVCTNGSHIMTLYYPLTSIPDENGNTFEVFLSITGGAAKVGLGQAMASVTGQGLLALYYVSKWDGTITIEEKLNPINIGTNKVSVGKMKDQVVINTDQPSSPGINEVFTGIKLNSQMQVLNGVRDNISFDYVIKTATFSILFANTYDYNISYVSTKDSKFSLNTSYRYTSVEEAIDVGRMARLVLPKDDNLAVTNVELEVVKHG